MRDIGRWGKLVCENHTNHVLRYKKLLLDYQSGIMKYQTSSHGGIKPLTLINKSSNTELDLLVAKNLRPVNTQ